MILAKNMPQNMYVLFNNLIISILFAIPRNKKKQQNGCLKNDKNPENEQIKGQYYL